MRIKLLTRRTVGVGAFAIVLLSLGAAVFARQSSTTTTLANSFPFPNSSGTLETVSSTGSIDLTNPFFQSLGTNDRTCATCHQPDQDWTVSASSVQARFNSTAGLDPIFRTVDGSNCDTNIDVSTVQGRQSAYSLLTSRGVIRVALAVPAGAQFEVASVQNPYGCNDTETLSMYRRPLPTTNLRFLSTVMSDGRESTTTATSPTVAITGAASYTALLYDLSHQALDAANSHAQASTPLTGLQQQQIVDFETALTTAQAVDSQAGSLSANGATGDPANLVNQNFFIGINDPFQNNPLGTTFTPAIYSLFTAWLTAPGPPPPPPVRGAGPQAPPPPPPAPLNTAALSIARGEALFNSKPIRITNVGGLNDVLNVPAFAGTCGTCHDSPNVGNHSISAPLNIGTGNPGLSPLDLTYLPLMTLKSQTTAQTIMTTDPGRALVTGLWADVGKIKVPVLRGLAARAPYFHNGSARGLQDVVHFYDVRFRIGLTPQETADLVAFLSAL